MQEMAENGGGAEGDRTPDLYTASEGIAENLAVSRENNPGKTVNRKRTSAIFGPNRSQSAFETVSVGKRSSREVRGGCWLDQKRGRTSGIWQVAWYDPQMGTVRYRTTGTRDRGVAQAFLEAHIAGHPIAPAVLAPARQPALCYFIGGDVGGIKIGASTAPSERLNVFQLQSPIRLQLLAVCDGGLKSERAYHARFAAHRLHGEWFERAPEILEEIERLNALASHQRMEVRCG